MIGPLPDQPRMHLDRGYDSDKTRDLLEILGYHAQIAAKGTPAPIQAGKRWPVERCHLWMNGYGKLHRFTDKRKIIVEFYLYLAATLTVIRRLINRARTHYRWPTRPTTRRLR
jgi:DDE family transposase